MAAISVRDCCESHVAITSLYCVSFIRAEMGKVLLKDLALISRLSRGHKTICIWEQSMMTLIPIFPP